VPNHFKARFTRLYFAAFTDADSWDADELFILIQKWHSIAKPRFYSRLLENFFK
jgi:hypothetical protein